MFAAVFNRTAGVETLCVAVSGSDSGGSWRVRDICATAAIRWGLNAGMPPPNRLIFIKSQQCVAFAQHCSKKSTVEMDFAFETEASRYTALVRNRIANAWSYGVPGQSGFVRVNLILGANE